LKVANMKRTALVIGKVLGLLWLAVWAAAHIRDVIENPRLAAVVAIVIGAAIITRRRRE
jgi:uncharacterized membrane-anchored protein